MNQLPGKKERDAFDEALPATLTGRTEQKSDELSLSGTHAQPVPFFNIAGQFGARVVQFAVKPVIDYDLRKPAISKKVLAAMAGDPDPAKSLADIRKLLVGPTHKLHDAMFEEVITILEESDREVQDSLQSLESRCVKLSHATNELVSSSVESRDQNRIQIELLRKEIQKSATAQQDMLSEMFLAIDSKIEELAAQIEAANLLESRVANLERRSSSDQDDLREVFADGLSRLADRFKALHHG